MSSCQLTPEIISKGGNKIYNNQPIIQPPSEHNTEIGFGWLFWYIPIALIALGWGYREFIKRKKS